MDTKCVVVTGSSSGIGRACALKLGCEGYNVVINYKSNEEKALDVVREIEAMGSHAIAVKADVSTSEGAKYLINEACREFEDIDILINNAGYLHDDYLLMLSDKEIDKSIDINIKSYFYCSRQAVLKMIRKKCGKIINMSSVSYKKAIAGQALYSATKGAVSSMTMVLAKELSAYGITVNAVAPGFVNTDMLKKIPEKKAEEYKQMIPLKRAAEPSEIAEVVSFLCSEKSNYITGQVITCDGGLSI